MRNTELLSFFNETLVEYNQPFHFSSWDKVRALDCEKLEFLLNFCSELVLKEGMQNGEINKIGIAYEDIFDILNRESINRSVTI